MGKQIIEAARREWSRMQGVPVSGEEGCRRAIRLYALGTFAFFMSLTLIV